MPNTQLITVTLDGRKQREPILLGHESQALVPYYVQFDIAAWREHFGDGAAALLHQRKGDANPYVVPVTTEGDIVTWEVSNVDNGILGTGKCELLYYVAGKAVKSDVWLTKTMPALGVEINPPDPYESSIEQVAALAAQSSADASSAEQSAEKAAQSAEEAAASNEEVQQAKSELQDALDGVAQEPTAQDILEELRGIAETAPEEASRAARAAALAVDAMNAINDAAEQAEGGGYVIIYGDGLVFDRPNRTVSVDMVDELRAGDMRLVTSNAVNEVVGDVAALLAEI